MAGSGERRPDGGGGGETKRSDWRGREEETPGERREGADVHAAKRARAQWRTASCGVCPRGRRLLQSGCAWPPCAAPDECGPRFGRHVAEVHDATDRVIDRMCGGPADTRAQNARAALGNARTEENEEGHLHEAAAAPREVSPPSRPPRPDVDPLSRKAMLTNLLDTHAQRVLSTRSESQASQRVVDRRHEACVPAELFPGRAQLGHRVVRISKGCPGPRGAR